MSDEPLMLVLNELRNGQLKGESRTALLSANPSQRKGIPFLSELLSNLNPSVKQCYTSSVEMVWITAENFEDCLSLLSSVKALGLGYLAFDDNGRVSNDPYLAQLRYISFGVSPTKACIADLRIIALESLIPLLTSKTLKLTYNSLPFLGLMRHLDILISHISDLRLLDIILLCGLGNLKPNLSDTILRHLDEKVVFPELTHLLTREDTGLILATQASYLFALAEKIYPKIRQEKLWKVAKIEMQSIYALSDIQYNGMPFCIQRVRDFSETYRTERECVASQLHQILDYVVETPEGPLSRTINLDSPSQILKALRRIGLNLQNTRESTLALYKNEHEVVTLLIKYKQLSYQVQHIGESYLRYLHPITHRIHAKVNPVGTRTSRIIITEPNLQGIKHGINRQLFRAPDGYVFVSGDYRQIEVLIYAVLSCDEMLLADCAGDEDVYIIIGRMFLNCVSISDENRRKIKPVVLGLLYNLTDFGLCRYSRSFGVEITMTEAATWRTLFFKRYAGVARYQKNLALKACSERCVESIVGRKRCFDTRRVTAERPDGISYGDFKALIGSVANYSAVIDECRAIYTVEHGDEARILQDQLFDLDLNTSIEPCDPPMGAVYNGVAQMTCVDLIKTALSALSSISQSHLKKAYKIVDTAHDDLSFIVNQEDSLLFADKLKDVMINASYELFRPHKAKVEIKIGEDYDF